MKKSIILGAVALVAASLTSCDDFLNDNRYPLDKQTANPEFWSNPVNVQGELNYFYEQFTGYGNAAGYGEFYFNTLSDDQANGIGQAAVTPWNYITVPVSSGNWSTPYAYLRRANLAIEGVTSSSLQGSERENFLAIAHLFRAWNHYLLVRAYGDVPMVDKALDTSDEDVVFGERTPRNKVMDLVLEDLNFAVANISTSASKTAFSADLAAAMKAEICLFEGAYAKYNAKDNARAEKFFKEVVNATQPLLAKYPICDDYASLYISTTADLKGNDEVIFMKEYALNVFMHSTADYTSSSTPISGITKDAFDAYLFKDGKPLATTTCDKNDAGVMVDGKLSIADVLAVRDARLSATIDDVVFYTDMAYARNNSMDMTSLTGYGVKKYVDPTMPYENATTANKCYTACPLFWGAEMALAYAEAKAELGTLTDGDLDQTLNKLYARAGLPAQTVASLTAMADPANNMGVSSLIWEVRRCRRCELIMDNDIRYWDLVRWNQLGLLDTTKYPNITLGANVKNSTVAVAKKGDYIDAANGTTRVFTDREKLFPIPSHQIDLNSQLTQNPGWK